jgi:hypothetical protein
MNCSGGREGFFYMNHVEKASLLFLAPDYKMDYQRKEVYAGQGKGGGNTAPGGSST